MQNGAFEIVQEISFYTILISLAWAFPRGLVAKITNC